MKITKDLPHYSQYLDVKKRSWQSRACGIVSLRTLMEYWNHRGKIRRKNLSPIDDLYKKGLTAKAYIKGVGWKHAGLAAMARHYGLKGSTNYDLAGLERLVAVKKLAQALKKSPVIVSVYKNYNIRNNGGHLPILISLNNERAVLFDPGARTRGAIKRTMSAERFLSGWKKRFIVIKP